MLALFWEPVGHPLAAKIAQKGGPRKREAVWGTPRPPKWTPKATPRPPNEVQGYPKTPKMLPNGTHQTYKTTPKMTPSCISLVEFIDYFDVEFILEDLLVLILVGGGKLY